MSAATTPPAKFLFADVTQRADGWFATCRFTDADDEDISYTLSQGGFPDRVAARDWVRECRTAVAEGVA